MLALTFAGDSSESSTAVVVGEYGNVIDHAILGRGGRIGKSVLDEVMNNVVKIFSHNLSVDVIVMNTGLMNQTITIQKEIAKRIEDFCVSFMVWLWFFCD